MKQVTKKLHFKKNVVTELNDTTLHTINGGTSHVVTSDTNSVIINTNTITTISFSRGTAPFCDGISIKLPTATKP